MQRQAPSTPVDLHVPTHLLLQGLHPLDQPGAGAALQVCCGGSQHRGPVAGSEDFFVVFLEVGGMLARIPEPCCQPKSWGLLAV